MKFNDMIKKQPPWVTNSPVKQRWMTVWVIHQLDEADMEKHRMNMAKPFDKALLLGKRRPPNPPNPHQAEIDASARGDVKLLRMMFPLHARLINPPKGIGKPRPFSHARWAAMDVRRIRDLWQKHYDGKKNREGLKPTAVEIARERWAEPWGGPTDDQIDNALRKLPRKK